MCEIHTTTVRDAHAYTRSKVPWRIGEYRGAAAETSRGVKFGWRLFHYLSGGGMKAFGRTIRQDELDLRRNRFLALAAVFGAVWLALLIF